VEGRGAWEEVWAEGGSAPSCGPKQADISEEEEEEEEKGVGYDGIAAWPV
jgi:hypothetical protein